VKKKNPFIDDQALVTRDEEEEEDDEEEEGFVVPDAEVDEVETAVAPALAHRAWMREEERAEEPEGVDNLEDEGL